MDYTLLDLARDVLRTANKPLKPSEIWQEGVRQKLDLKVKELGKMPWRGITAQIYADIKLKNRDSQFWIADMNPTRFALIQPRFSDEVMVPLEASTLPENPESKSPMTAINAQDIAMLKVQIDELKQKLDNLEKEIGQIKRSNI